MTEEVKTAVDAMTSAFEEFKKVNDERLAEIEAKGEADPFVEEKLAKLESEMDKFETINQSITQQQKASEGMEEKLAEIETMLKRPANGMDVKDIDVNLKAWDTFMRKGEDGLDEIEKKALTVGTAATVKGVFTIYMIESCESATMLEHEK